MDIDEEAKQIKVTGSKSIEARKKNEFHGKIFLVCNYLRNIHFFNLVIILYRLKS